MAIRIRFRAWLVVALVALGNGLLWQHYFRPVDATDSGYPLRGLSFNPFKRDQNPFNHVQLSRQDLEADLQKIAHKTESIRLYSSAQDLQELPSLAQKFNLRIIVSAWLDGRPDANAIEVESAIAMAGANRNVTRVILGNETQLTNTVSREELIAYLREARKRLRTPVSTAEPWDFWIKNPEFVKEVDFIAVHILPYWQEIPIDQAVDYVIAKYHEVRTAYPGKVVVIGETGWPSDGSPRGAAEASIQNEARFIRDFILRAAAEKIEYNIIEAFDQPWKHMTEGRAGEHFGIMDADRSDKFPLAGPIVEDPMWRSWALSSLVIGVLATFVWFIKRPRLGLAGQFFSALTIQASASAATVLAHEAAGQYLSASELAFWTIMILAQALLAIIFLTDSSEIADVVGNRPLRRSFKPLVKDNKRRYPFVSVHLACCSEPPRLVSVTLRSLAALEYDDFEVIVVDNNTSDESLWRPIEKLCQELGPRFRFFSLGKYPGFKAGALNYALSVTDKRAEVIGVVDADYIVDPRWLTATIPYFSDASIAVVQSPQEHRGWDGNIFQRMENDEYTGFFRIGMVQRNEHNAIIQHGTMTLVRRSDLDHVKGWAQWCICEDTELGLRLLNLGKQAIYIDHPLGHGLVPDSYAAYSKQRFRWAYGGVRIFRRYIPELLGLRGNLTRAQRYQFIKGWLPWFGDALHSLFTLAALVWSGFLLARPLQTDFPEPIFIYPALALIALRIIGTAWTYSSRVRIGFWRTLLAMLAGGSLTHKVAKAVFQGLLTSSKPFYRTPKLDSAPRLIQSLATVTEEFGLAICLWGAAYGVISVFGVRNDSAVLWCVTLMAQSIPYLAAVIVATLSARGTRHDTDQMVELLETAGSKI